MNELFTRAGRPVRRVTIALGSIAVAVMLSSCGGSDNGDSTPDTPPTASNVPPASASQNSEGFIAYLKTLVPTMQDAVEPLDVAAFVAPSSDTADPDPSI